MEIAVPLGMWNGPWSSMKFSDGTQDMAHAISMTQISFKLQTVHSLPGMRWKKMKHDE